jgi:hypothetical protein
MLVSDIETRVNGLLESINNAQDSSRSIRFKLGFLSLVGRLQCVKQAARKALHSPSQSHSSLLTSSHRLARTAFELVVFSFSNTRASQVPKMLKDEKSDIPGVCNQDVVCVLGMHRSGTSLLTRTLNLLGLHLGSNKALATQPASYNAKGHWEHEEFTWIGNSLLQRYGGSWHDPPSFPAAWERSATLDDLKDKARRLILSEFGSVDQWGWKDPRTCITLPFWQQLLPNMRYVICLRNPVDVCHSLANRDGFSAQKSSFLWFTYVCSALSYTQGKRRLVLFYEDLLDDHLPQLHRLAEFLGQSEKARSRDVQNAVRNFVDKDLQHYRTRLNHSVLGLRMEVYAQVLYLAQRISVTFENEPAVKPQVDGQFDEALAGLTRYFPPTNETRSPVQGTKTRHTLISDIRFAEKDQGIARRLAQLIRAFHLDPIETKQLAQQLSTQLLQIQTELPRVREGFSRKMLSHYKYTKNYLTPIYRYYAHRLSKPLRSKSAQP